VPAQAAPLARTGPQDAAPAAAGVSELMQLQQATARDVADLKREVEQLKVKQDQLATDNSKAIEQLKTKLEDMARQVAKASEQSASPRTSPPSTGPLQSLQARMRPQAPPPRRQFRPRWQYYDDEWYSQ
jgi:DNA repair exonuclease SbcCD ATPase subunit